MLSKKKNTRKEKSGSGNSELKSHSDSVTTVVASNYQSFPALHKQYAFELLLAGVVDILLTW
jgi:hypothetical protein